MTISSENKRNDFVGNGTTDTYSYTFKIASENDLKVTQRNLSDVETTLVLNTDYTVTGVGAAAGGTIVLTAGNLTSGFALTIRRDSELKQETDIRNQGDFYPETHEDVFDHLMSVDQTQQVELDRSIKIPETYPNVSTELPGPVADKVLKWNSAGTALTNVDPGDATLNIPADDSVTGPKIDDSALFVFPTMLSLQKGADVASAAALALTLDGNYFDITGTTAITSINTIGIGTQVILQFDAALTLTHHVTDLILPGGANITTAAGDHALMVEYALGKWRCVGYFPADGNPLSLSDYLTTAQTVSGAWTISGAFTFSAAPVLQGSAWPSFSVDASAGTAAVPNITWTKIEFNTEEFDTNNDFDSATNYRFTPTVAGKYLLTAQVIMAATAAGDLGYIRVYKNGAGYKETRDYAEGAVSFNLNISVVVDANGSTDYFEIFVYHNCGSSKAVNTAAYATYFTGSRIG